MYINLFFTAKENAMQICVSKRYYSPFILVFIIVAFLFFTTASASPGGPVPVFGNGGQVTSANKIFRILAKQPDGKIIVAGSVRNITENNNPSTQEKIVKRLMGSRSWKNIHLLSYGTALLFLIHGMIIDPQLKDRPMDLIDAEKIVSEGCLLLIITATIIRYRYYLANKKFTGVTTNVK